MSRTRTCGRAAVPRAHRLLAVAGRGHHVVPGLGEVARDRVPPHRVVVGDHDPDLSVHGPRLYKGLPTHRTSHPRLTAAPCASPRPTLRRRAGPRPGHPHLDLGALAGDGDDFDAAAEVVQPALDRVGDAEPAGAAGLLQPALGDAGAVVADGHDHAVAARPRPGSRLGAEAVGAGAAVMPDVVQRCRHRRRHLAAPGPGSVTGSPGPEIVTRGPASGPSSADRQFDRVAAAAASPRASVDQRAQRPLLLPGHAAQVRPGAADLRAAPLDQGQHLQDAVVDVAGQALALAGGGLQTLGPDQSELGGAAELGDVADGHAEQGHQDDVVDRSWSGRRARPGRRRRPGRPRPSRRASPARWPRRSPAAADQTVGRVSAPPGSAPGCRPGRCSARRPRRWRGRRRGRPAATRRGVVVRW